MTYPPPNPYDPNQQPGYGQPSQPQHFTTDADPYARPDHQGQAGYGQPAYPNPPMSVAPGSVPPGVPTTGQPYQPGQAFQPGQPAPLPPRRSSNLPLILTLVVIVVAIAGGAVFIGMTLTGEDDDVATGNETTGEAEPSEEGATTEPTPDEATSEAGDEAVYRLPKVDECIEDVKEGFYVVACDAETAYWLVLHIEQNPDDPDPEDPWHSAAATDACEGLEWTQYYFTDTAVTAGRDWDPEVDSINAIYCVREV
ncbi:hypothetical protein L0U85_02995 [Glycomyces sp. L485]|uniref:hypothetical protein n=1 Tax=Glycomyces sp. L485 TaxID=2909235 RepID=UPI001F4ADEF0|nr:hypothetical protein [Glycomyces sp. L485]MCH7229831.1 hypothetical protein [Glycomyces sp. L485]